METSGGTSIWLWILGGVALIVAVLGLIVAVSANDSSVDEKKVAEEATAQIESELSGVGGAVAEDKQRSDEAAREAARDRRRIKRSVAAAAEKERKQQKRINALTSEVAELEDESARQRKGLTNLRSSVTELTTQTEDLEAQVEKLRSRLNSSNGGSG